MLRRNPAGGIRAFVIWEPVLQTDWSRPDPSITALVADNRAIHFWDHDRRLSALYGGASSAPTVAAISTVNFKMTNVIWDAALVYSPGAHWGSRAHRLVAPVYKSADSLLDP